jgi:outer membrane immunogenic protein
MNRLKLVAATTAALLLSTSIGSASPFEFAGFYAGAHAGYSDSSADFGTGDLNNDALIGGLQAGYNFLSGNFLYGVETDISLTGASPDGSCPYSPGFACEVNAGPMATLRGRLGYAVDDWLVYVTGGAAGAKFELETNGPGGRDSGLFGWTVGAGPNTSSAISSASSWSIAICNSAILVGSFRIRRAPKSTLTCMSSWAV